MKIDDLKEASYATLTSCRVRRDVLIEEIKSVGIQLADCENLSPGEIASLVRKGQRLSVQLTEIYNTMRQWEIIEMHLQS